MVLGPLTAEAFKTARGRDGEIARLGIREQAAQLFARAKLGADPAGEEVERRHRAAETFEAIGNSWLAKKTAKDNVRPGTYRHLERHILRYAKKLHGLKLVGITRRIVGAEIEAIGAGSGPVAANA